MECCRYLVFLMNNYKEIELFKTVPTYFMAFYSFLQLLWFKVKKTFYKHFRCLRISLLNFTLSMISLLIGRLWEIETGQYHVCTKLSLKYSDVFMLIMFPELKTLEWNIQISRRIINLEFKFMWRTSNI